MNIRPHGGGGAMAAQSGNPELGFLQIQMSIHLSIQPIDPSFAESSHARYLELAICRLTYSARRSISETRDASVLRARVRVRVRVRVRGLPDVSNLYRFIQRKRMHLPRGSLTVVHSGPVCSEKTNAAVHTTTDVDSP